MTERKTKEIALAVQGGGSHGAFTWGVLDRLLDEVAAGRLRIAALSGTSAGGFNATLTAYGLGKSVSPVEGAAEAKRLLADFWQGDARLAPFSLYTATAAMWHLATGNWNIDDSPVVLATSILGQMATPYGMPAVEWLHLAIGRTIDFEELRAQKYGPELYITATNIGHNRRDIFSRTAVTFDVLAASATLPGMSPARPIVIDGETQYYWDGGFMGNPSLSPLAGHCHDIVLIQVNPFKRPDSPPKTATAIADRLNEITFNASLVLELSSLAEANKSRARPLCLHSIADEPFLIGLGTTSKLVIIPEFLEELRAKGFETADAWLADPERGGQLGHRTTLDMNIFEKVIANETIIRDCPQPAGKNKH